jgi:L-alanine-DL-glutamate epimerase-like enolase superfamily enzyme
MKIKEIRVYKKDLALTRPYTVAYQTFTKAVNAFLEIELENGIIGIGAAAEGSYVTGETIEDTLNNLGSEEIRTWTGWDIRHYRSLIEESNRLYPQYPATRAAIDIALHDAFCKFLNISVVDFYGRKHIALPTSITIGIGEISEILSEAREYKSRGFRILKIKTGLNVDRDIEGCTKLREEFSDFFKIRVDANQGYSPGEMIKFIKGTVDLGLELVEQPLPVGQESEMKKLPAHIRKKIACDESLKNAKSAFQLATGPAACGIFNIKLMKCGGLVEAMKIATIAHTSGIDLFWGCFDESKVSISAALHAAYACKGTKYLDLDGSFDLAEDIVTGGFQLKDGMMNIINGPGFGFKKI